MIKQGLDYDSNVCLRRSTNCFPFDICLKRNRLSCKTAESHVLQPLLYYDRDLKIEISFDSSICMCFRATTCGGGFQSCRTSEEVTCTHPGHSAPLRCHTLTWPLAGPTSRHISKKAVCVWEGEVVSVIMRCCYLSFCNRYYCKGMWSDINRFTFQFCLNINYFHKSQHTPSY